MNDAHLAMDIRKLYTNLEQGSRARWYMTPYTIILWGSLGGSSTPFPPCKYAMELDQ